EFDVAAYDRSKTLVIDPVLNYSTYFTGSSNTVAAGIAIDSTQDAYIIGNTISTSFPPAPTTACATCGTLVAGTNNGFVAALNPSGSALLYNTFFGGNADTTGETIALDGSNNAFIGGRTMAPNFPTTAGAYATADP